MDLIDWGHRRVGVGGGAKVEPLILLGFCVFAGEGDTGKLHWAPAICWMLKALCLCGLVSIGDRAGEPDTGEFDSPLKRTEKSGKQGYG